MQQPKNVGFICLKLLQRRTTDARNNPHDKPALQAHLDNREVTMTSLSRVPHVIRGRAVAWIPPAGL
jgi:hypothetical protein